MLKLVVLALLSIPSIIASIEGHIAKALIAENDTGKLGQTFQALHKEHDDDGTSEALAEVAEQGHPEMVVTCLRVHQDPFPNDKMCVSRLVHYTLVATSNRTSYDSESFAKVITSFKPTDVKPLAAIRHWTPSRLDAVDVLGRVMAKSTELITDTLPSWLASHTFDRNSRDYDGCQTAIEKTFKYLASFATESVLEKALSIVGANEHYQIGSWARCCKSEDYFPQDLIDKLTGLLELVKVRNELVKGALSFMPVVLLNLLAEYITYETA
jgi:hypothetical protein